MATIAREAFAYYTAEFISTTDFSGMGREVTVVALVTLVAGFSLLGAVLDFRANTDNIYTRLGRVCMASIVTGGLLFAALTGNLEGLLPGTSKIILYCAIRDVAQAFFTLTDDAGGPTAKSTVASMAMYGTFQFVLDQVSALVPLSGSGRFAAGLEHSVVADLIHGVLNGLGETADSVISVLSRFVFSPSLGLRPAMPDPESVEQSARQLRAQARWPSGVQFAQAITTIFPSRCLAFISVQAVAAAVASLLENSDYSEFTQGLIISGCVGMMLILIYGPFVMSCSQSEPKKLDGNSAA